MIGNLVAAALVDRFGRKILLILSCASTSVSIATLGIYFYLEEKLSACSAASDCPASATGGGITPELLHQLRWLPLTSLMVFLFGNNIGLGPVPWLMNGEMFAEEAKGSSSALATVTHWTSVFFVTRFAADLQRALSPSGSYFLWASFSALAVVYVVVLVPETKGKGPEEIRAHFLGGK